MLIFIISLFSLSCGFGFWIWFYSRPVPPVYKDCLHLRSAETEDAIIKCLDCGETFTYDQYKYIKP